MPRKPLAQEVHRAKGTYRHDPARENKNAPTANGLEPVMPEEFNDLERRKWIELLGDLRTMGVLSSECRELMIGYCTAYASWVQAREIVEREGLIVGGKRHPVLVELHKHRATLNRLLPEFGLTPSSRSKLVSFSNTEEDPFESFVSRLTGKN